ncbi:MAG: hypothetical protein AAB470_00630 [Patescibacteria group bacterium]
MKTLALTLVLVVSMIQSYAVVVIGDQDNSILPIGRGADSVGIFNSTAGVVVSSNYFLAGNHVGGNVGDTFTINGITYTTIAKTNDPNYLDIYGNPDVEGNTLWKISGCFPTSRIAKLYTNGVGIGRPITVFGRGTQRGNLIYKNSSPPRIENFVKGDAFIEFDVIGGTVSANFAIQCATNIAGTWTTLTETYTVPGNQNVHVSIPVTADPNMFFRTVMTEPILIGWSIGMGDGVMRWGTNIISETQNTEKGYILVSTFDRNGGSEECAITPGDSSGAAFAKDSDSKWKLIGINYSSDAGISYSFDGSDVVFAGTLFDVSGLYMWGNPYQLPSEYGVILQRSFYAPIPWQWIKEVIHQNW